MGNIDLSKPNYNEYGVDNRVKAIELELLSYIHEFCVEHGINYYIYAGTLLGSLRHKGFIPWDDDIDIAMMREDFEKFYSLSSLISDKYYLAFYENTKGYQYNFAKLEYKNSELIEFIYPKGRHGGVYLDIFILDGVPSDYKSHKRIFHKNVWWKIKNNALHRFYSKNIFLKTFWNTLGFFMRLKYRNNTADFHRKWDSICKHSTINSEWIADQFGSDLEGFIPKEYYGNPQLYEFEGMLFYGPERAEKCLEHLYGNWRELPPIEKRKAAHGFSVKFT